MTKKSGNKQFTDAQVRRLTALIQALSAAQRDVDNFAGYLSDEHGLTADGGAWELAPDYSGFVRKAAEG